MNTEQWIKDNTHRYTGTVTIESLRKLFDTHAVVPREPSVEMLTRGNSQQEWAQSMRLTYKAMIKASEEEL